MELWLDSIQKETIDHVNRIGLLHGITTNPSILSRARDVRATIEDLLERQPGPVAVQVIATHAADMIQEAKTLYRISPRLLVKIPVCQEGLAAISSLSKEGIATLGTAVMEPRQALLAALAGAKYVAPYASRIDLAGYSAVESIQSMQQIFSSQKLACKVMVASIKTSEQVLLYAKSGIAAVTVKDTLLFDFLQNNTLSDSFTDGFRKEWMDSFSSSLANLLSLQTCELPREFSLAPPLTD